MLINLNATQAKSLLNILDTEGKFNTLPECLNKTILEIEDGLENYEFRERS